MAYTYADGTPWPLSQFIIADPVVANGVTVPVRDTTGTKTGDGVTHWSLLPWNIPASPPAGVTDADVPAYVAAHGGGGGEGGVPDDNSVTNAKVATGAGISADKLADGTTLKVMTAAERTKLAGVAAGATVNSTDAVLKARANHTGTQTASTVSDFATATLTAMAGELRKTDCVIAYSGTQPLRTTGTTDTSRRVRWVSATAPSIATGYAIDGLDVWEKLS